MVDLTLMKIENVEDFPEYINEQRAYWLEDLIEAKDSFFYIFALIEKRVVGVATFQSVNEMECLYGSLCVIEDMRRKGIAQKIIEAGIENLRTKGVKKLTVLYK